MAQVIVNPQLMTNFACELARFTADLRDREASLGRSLEALNATWKDERYARFNRRVEEASLQLQIFYNRSAAYSEYLRRKAAAARAYLGG